MAFTVIEELREDPATHRLIARCPSLWDCRKAASLMTTGRALIYEEQTGRFVLALAAGEHAFETED